jgi:hypothetical protein
MLLRTMEDGIRWRRKLSATENSIRWQMKPKTMGANINKKMTQMTVEDSTYQTLDEGHDYGGSSQMADVAIKTKKMEKADGCTQVAKEDRGYIVKQTAVVVA